MSRKVLALTLAFTLSLSCVLRSVGQAEALGGQLLTPFALNAQTAPTFSPDVKPAEILREALADAHSAKNPAYRVNCLLKIAPVLEKFDPQAAAAVLEEARVLTPKLPEGPSLWSELLGAALQGAVSGAIMGATGISPNSPQGVLITAGNMSRMNQNRVEAIQEYLALKDRLSLQLAERLAPKNASGALEIARSIKDQHGRALGIEISLQAWPKNERESALSIIRNLAGVSSKEQSSAALLAALANGAESHDTSLARELAHRAVNSLDDKVDALTAGQAYAALARLDPEAARRLITELATRSRANHNLLAAFASGVATTHPELSWQALKGVDKRDGKLFAARAAVLRQLVKALPPAMKDEVRDIAMELLAFASDPKSKYDIGQGLYKLPVISDAIVVLGAIDPDIARAQAQQIGLPEYTAEAFLDKIHEIIPMDKETKKRLGQTFFRDLVRLDLALSRLSDNTRDSLVILESLDDTFWYAQAYITRRLSLPTALLTEVKAELVRAMAETHSAESISRTLEIAGWLDRLMIEVKTEWPRAVAAIAEAHPAEATRSLRRFLEVAERLDTAAAGIFKKEKESRDLWPFFYLPFALTFARRALQAREPAAAALAFEKSVKLAESLPSPAREWALCWNAAALKGTDSNLVAIESQKAVKSALALKAHKPWEYFLPRLIHQIARLDPAAALQLARSNGASDVRAFALLAVVTGSLDETSARPGR